MLQAHSVFLCARLVSSLLHSSSIIISDFFRNYQHHYVYISETTMLVHTFISFALYTVLNIIRSYNLHEEVIKKYSLMH